MAAAVLAGVLGSCVALAWRPVTLLGRELGVDRGLLPRLQQIPQPERSALAAREADAGSWARELAGELGDTVEETARAVAANLALADAEHRIDARERWPRAAGWLAVAAGVLATLLAWRLWGWRAATVALCETALALAACALGGSRLRLARKLGRERCDQLVRLLLGELYDAEIVLPRRRRRGWQEPRFRGR